MSPPYLVQILALHAAGHLRRGRVHHIDVLHDDWCPRLRGGDCRCDPELVLDGRPLEVARS